MSTRAYIRLTGALALLGALQVSATVMSVEFGTSPPTSALGGYSMQGFTDPSPVGGLVVGVAPPAAAPVSGDLEFSTGLIHYKANQGIDTAWATWSHGFKGDVYHYDVFPSDPLVEGADIYGLLLALPKDTKAFYLYIEPAFFDVETKAPPEFKFDITATDSSGDTDLLTSWIQGQSGAKGFGFYTGADQLTEISIVGYDVWPDGFAVGEFGINSKEAHGVPEGGTSVVLFAVALAGLRFLHRRTPS